MPDRLPLHTDNPYYATIHAGVVQGLPGAAIARAIGRDEKDARKWLKVLGLFDTWRAKRRAIAVTRWYERRCLPIYAKLASEADARGLEVGWNQDWLKPRVVRSLAGVPVRVLKGTLHPNGSLRCYRGARHVLRIVIDVTGPDFLFVLPAPIRESQHNSRATMVRGWKHQPSSAWPKRRVLRMAYKAALKP
jgi:hypothetical protein